MTQRADFISHSSGGWEVQDQGTGKCSSWWMPSSWFAYHLLLLAVCSHGLSLMHGERSLSSVSCYKGINPIMRAPLSWPNYLPKAMWSGASPSELWRDTTQPIAVLQRILSLLICIMGTIITHSRGVESIVPATQSPANKCELQIVLLLIMLNKIQYS